MYPPGRARTCGGGRAGRPFTGARPYRISLSVVPPPRSGPAGPPTRLGGGPAYPISSQRERMASRGLWGAGA
eukprot:7100993-Prymnesium_polylepis.1